MTPDDISLAVKATTDIVASKVKESKAQNNVETGKQIGEMFTEIFNAVFESIKKSKV